jgi:hypothetical protein
MNGARSSRKLVLVAATGAALLLAASPTPAGAASSWAVVGSPSRGTIANYLTDVAATSTSSGWAVGSWYDTSRAAPRTLALRWNGAQWSTVATPNATGYYNELTAVDSTASNDVWAVGYANGSSGVNGAPRNNLALHYNGTSWSVVTTPQPGVQTRELYDVEALAARNAWAVGWYYDTGFVAESLVLHWNGTSWLKTDVPNPGNGINQLYGVGASSPTDVWAVGTTTSAGDPRGSRHPLALHYNGTAWSTVPMPDTASGSALLRSVTAISPTDAWAVGSQSGYSQPVAYHWNGTAWSLVSTPAVGSPGNNLFYRVTALDSGRVWAVGYTSGSASGPQPLVERWNGSTWSVEPTPTQPLGGAAQGVAAIAGSAGTATVWVSGYRTAFVNGGYTDRTLTLRGTGG